MNQRFRCIALLAICTAPLLASAQDTFPSKPLRVIVPWPPGGPPDLLARILAPRMSELLGRPMVVENRAGATGAIGTDQVAKSAPDGYTLLVTSSQPLVIVPSMSPTPYDPLRDLAPIALLNQSAVALVTNPALGVETAAELVAMAKAKPGAITYSSSGIGSYAHIAGELIKLETGIQMVHVPFQGVGPAITAVVSGQVHAGVPAIQAAAPIAKAGKVRALGVTGPAPSPLMPGIAPLAAQGYRNVVVNTWAGAFAPVNTPRPVLARIRDSMEKVYREPDTQDKLAKASIEATWDGADGLSKLLEFDFKLYRRVITEAKIKPE
jgi:tripartite-type tricarboxylate transporter receptor subunit TctC